MASSKYLPLFQHFVQDPTSTIVLEVPENPTEITSIRKGLQCGLLRLKQEYNTLADQLGQPSFAFDFVLTLNSSGELELTTCESKEKPMLVVKRVISTATSEPPQHCDD